MISLDGAGLVAQVYPVAILMLALESTRFRQKAKLESPWKAIRILVRHLVSLISVLGAIWSVFVSVVSVSAGTPPNAVEAVVIFVSGVGLTVSGTFLVLELMGAAFDQRLSDGSWEGLIKIRSRRRAEQAAASPAKHD
jgi:hypothetical protein